MTNTRKYTVTLEVDGVEIEINNNLTYSSAIAYAAQYLENRFRGSSVIDTVAYQDTVVELWKPGVYNYVCFVRPQQTNV